MESHKQNPVWEIFPDLFAFEKIFLTLLNDFFTFIVVQQSSQPNFIAFPSSTPSASPPTPNCLISFPKSVSQSVSQYLFCKEIHCVLFFKIPHVSDSIGCWCLTVWLTSLRMIISRSIHVVTNAAISYLWMAESYSIEYMYQIFIHSSADGHLSCFHVLAIAYSAQ